MRALPTTFRASLEDPNNPDPPIVFLTLDHTDWPEPRRFNWDVKDYILNGDTYQGFPFEIVLLSDGEGSPEGSLGVQNVDRRIGEEVKALSGDLTVTCEIYSAADFDLTVDPRVPLGIPSRAYRFTNVFLRDIEVNAIAVRGALRSWDFIQEPWPSRRATSALLPGLYM